MTLPHDSRTAITVAVKQSSDFHDSLSEDRSLTEINPLPSSPGSRTLRYEIVGPTRASVAQRSEEFRRGWGPAYMPTVGEPREAWDGNWVALATRWHSAD